jgi:cytoskeletal protein RodZ
VTGYGPPDDPSEAPTGYIDYGNDGSQQPQPGSPWYRKPIVLLVLGLFGAILIGLAIYVLADRTHGSGGPTQTPTSPTTSTEVTTTPAPTTTEVPAEPAPTTTLTFPPTTAEPTTTPATTTPPSTTTEDGHHHHHHHADGGTP